MRPHKIREPIFDERVTLLHIFFVTRRLPFLRVRTSAPPASKYSWRRNSIIWWFQNIDVLRQHRSAWSLEVEVRPWVEDF
jgi:hypothetical protein